MTQIIVIRPEPGLGATLAAGRAEGLAIAGWPLFEVRPVEWEAPAPETVDGLLLGSANAVRQAGPVLAAFRGKPVYAVGPSTAEAARRAGLEVVVAGGGGLQPLLFALAGKKLRLLRLAGAKRVTVVPPPGITLQTRVVYESAALPLPAGMIGALAARAVVLLHSAEAARHFAAECDRLGIARGPIALAALGPRIAGEAGEGWREVRAAASPREAAILALARDMCH